MSVLANTLFRGAFDAELAAMKEAHPDLTPADWWVAGKGKTKKRPEGENEAWWRANGPLMVDAWIAWRRKAGWNIWTTPENEPGIEVHIKVDVPDSGHDLVGDVDRVFKHPSGSLIVVDLKTGARSPESDLQLAVYRYGLWRMFGIEVDLGAYWLGRTGDVTEPFGLQRYTPHLMETILRQFITAKEAGIFLPRITFLCRGCPMRDYCAAYGGAKSFMDPDTQIKEVTT